MESYSFGGKKLKIASVILDILLISTIFGIILKLYISICPLQDFNDSLTTFVMTLATYADFQISITYNQSWRTGKGTSDQIKFVTTKRADIGLDLFVITSERFKYLDFTYALDTFKYELYMKCIEKVNIHNRFWLFWVIGLMVSLYNKVYYTNQSPKYTS